MGLLIFLVGFMLCGFIVYSFITYTIWKVVRGESIGEWTISRGKKYEPYYYRYTSYMRPRYDNVINPTPNPVYLSSEADGICDIFEEFLNKYNIKIPCEDAGEEKEREAGGNAAIYGMVYGDLQEEVEVYLRSMAESIDRRGWK